jgi:hypothetical protein
MIVISDTWGHDTSSYPIHMRIQCKCTLYDHSISYWCSITCEIWYDYYVFMMALLRFSDIIVFILTAMIAVK